MLECLILGDSIAVGLGQQSPQCVTIATGGINSRTYWLGSPAKSQAKRVIISLGSNDWTIDTETYLRRLRATIEADQVFWILPSAKFKPDERLIVSELARIHGDSTISIPTDWLGSDQIHLTTRGYKALTTRILPQMDSPLPNRSRS